MLQHDEPLSDLVIAACDLAENAGWSVHPCKADKTPYLLNWVTRASTDTDQIIRWWRDWPDALIGVLTGKESGILVVDVDDVGAFDTWRNEHGDMSVTVTAETHRGRHLYFRHPGEESIRNAKLPYGDLKADNAYVIAPPSRHPGGGEYRWVTALGPGDTQVAEIPESLSNYVRRKRDDLIPHELGLSEFPEQKFEQWFGNDWTFTDTWEQNRSDLKDQSPSGYCMSLANQAVNEGWSDEEVYGLLHEFRHIYGAQEKPEQWYMNTIAEARRSSFLVSEDIVSGELTECSSDIVVASPAIGCLLSDLFEKPELLKIPQAVFPGLLYMGRLTILAAREKTGKSTLMGYLAATISAGHDIAGESMKKGRVVWIGLEESLSDAARRFFDAGADPSYVLVIDRLTESPKKVLELVYSWNPDVIFIDSLSRWGESEITDWNMSAQVTRVVGQLADFCHQQGIAVISSHHATKKDGHYRDSTAIGANADLLVEMHEVMQRDKNERRFDVKGRFRVESFTLLFTGASYQRVGEPLSLQEQIREYVGQNPGCSKTEIRTSLNGANDRKSKTVAEMVSSGEIVNRGDDNNSRLYLCDDNDAGE